MCETLHFSEHLHDLWLKSAFFEGPVPRRFKKLFRGSDSLIQGKNWTLEQPWRSNIYITLSWIARLLPSVCPQTNSRQRSPKAIETIYAPAPVPFVSEGNMYVRPSVNVTAHKWLSSAMCAIAEVGVDVGCGSVQLSSRVEQFCGSWRHLRRGEWSLQFPLLRYVGVMRFSFCVLQFLLVGCTQQIVSALQIYKLEHQNKSHGNMDLPWLSYGWWKRMLADFATLDHRSSPLCSLLNVE